jgi:hypothetical protein
MDCDRGYTLTVLKKETGLGVGSRSARDDAGFSEWQRCRESQKLTDMIGSTTRKAARSKFLYSYVQFINCCIGGSVVPNPDIGEIDET